MNKPSWESYLKTHYKALKIQLSTRIAAFWCSDFRVIVVLFSKWLWWAPSFSESHMIQTQKHRWNDRWFQSVCSQYSWMAEGKPAKGPKMGCHMHSPVRDLLSCWASAVSFSKTFCSSMNIKTHCGFVGPAHGNKWGKQHRGVLPPRVKASTMKGLPQIT